MNVFCISIFICCALCRPLAENIGRLTLLDSKQPSDWLKLDQLVALSISDPPPESAGFFPAFFGFIFEFWKTVLIVVAFLVALVCVKWLFKQIISQ